MDEFSANDCTDVEDEKPVAKPAAVKSGAAKHVSAAAKEGSSPDDDSSDEVVEEEAKPAVKTTPAPSKALAKKELSSEDDSSGKEEARPAAKSAAALVKAAAKKEESSLDEDSSDEEEEAKPAAKAPAPAAVAKKEEKSSDDDDSSDEEKEPMKPAAKRVTPAEVKKEESSEDDDSGDEDEEKPAVIKTAPANAAAKEDSFDDEEPASKTALVEAEGGVNTCATPSCSNWAVVFNPKNEAVAKKFVNNLKKVAPSLGLTMAAPKSHMLMDNRLETFIQKLNIVLNKRPQIIMVIIDNSDQYRAVKKCIKKPTPSQCIMSTVLNKQGCDLGL